MMLQACASKSETSQCSELKETSHLYVLPVGTLLSGLKDVYNQNLEYTLCLIIIIID